MTQKWLPQEDLKLKEVYLNSKEDDRLLTLEETEVWSLKDHPEWFDNYQCDLE